MTSPPRAVPATPELATELERLDRDDRTRGSEIQNRRWYILRRIFAVSDIVALSAAVCLAILLRIVFDRPPLSEEEIAALVVSILLWPALGGLIGIYHFSGFDHSLADELKPVFLAATVWSWAPLLIGAALAAGSTELFVVIVLWALSITTVLVLRFVLYSLSRSASWFSQKVVLIGTPADTRQLVARIERHTETGLDVIGAAEVGPDGGLVFRGASREPAGPEPDRPATLEDITRFAVLSGADRAIVASPPESLGARSKMIRELIDGGLHVDVVAGDADVFSSSTVVHYFEGLPILSIPVVRLPRAWAIAKRAFDVAVSSLLLVALSGLIAYCWLRIKHESPGPAFFRQRRVGLRGRPFEILKFRTMSEGAEAVKDRYEDLNMHRSRGRSMFKIPGDPRVTPFGAKLRRWSLDELPQLWNVLRGEMSLVGPRPLIPSEAVLVDDDYRARFGMRPGITGPWQTLGRSHIPFEDMMKLDYTFVRNWTMAEDLRILARTFDAVVHGRGAY